MRLELNQLIHLALPLLGAQLAQVGTGVVDTVMAGRLSAVDLAGVSLGGSVLWPVTMACMGLLQAITPTVAQLNGARRHADIGENIRQGLWLALACSAVVWVLVTHAKPYYTVMGVDPAAIAVAVPYLQACAVGVPAVLMYFVLRFLAEGLGRTRPAMYIATTALLLKIPLNYVFIYGAFGLPRMGGVGCGVATAIVLWFECLAMLAVVSGSRYAHTGWYARFSLPSWRTIKQLLAIGVPIGATIFFEFGFFTFITVLIGRFGADSVASHTIAISLGSITFMFPLALGMASTIRVGYNVGAGEWERARSSAGIALVCSVVVAVIAALVVVFERDFIASLYTRDPVVLSVASRLMLFVAIYQLFDCTQVTVIGALRGFKDTRLPMFITLVGYWFVGLPIASALGFGWIGRPLHIYGFWIGLSISLAFVAVMVCARLWWVARRGPVPVRPATALSL